MTREQTIDPILAELISHCDRPADAAWASWSHGGRPWQIFASWDDALQKCHIYRADPREDAGPGMPETLAAWDAVERELRRLALPFDRWTTDWPNRLHISFQVPG